MEEWIKPFDLLEALTPPGELFVISSDRARAVCRRAHAGLLRAKAELLIWDKEERRDAIVPQSFWWAEGSAMLVQDWRAGDFSTRVKRSTLSEYRDVQVRAFGVTFSRAGAETMGAKFRTAKVEAARVAGHPTMRDKGAILGPRVKQARVEEWFRTVRVPAFEGKPPPTWTSCWDEARSYFAPGRVVREVLQAARREAAPADWQKRGPRTND